MLADMKIGFSEAMGQVGEKLSSSLSVLKDMQEGSMDKINALVNDILGLAPLIEHTGFNMKELSLDIGVPPGIHLTFIKEKEMEPRVIEQLLEENKDKDMLRFIVRALQKADAAQKAFNLAHYKFRGVVIKVGFPPDMSLKFSKD